jgi:hypothetical protein
MELDCPCVAPVIGRHQGERAFPLAAALPRFWLQSAGRRFESARLHFRLREAYLAARAGRGGHLSGRTAVVNPFGRTLPALPLTSRG